MSLSLLQLHLAQADRSLQRTRNSDQEKQDYQANLIKLYEKVAESANQQQTFSDQFIYKVKRVLDFIYKSLEFLDSSTLNLIPYETVECLKLALQEWLRPDENYIIVTSLINQIDGFSFDPALVRVDGQYAEFKQKYGVEFTSRLVQINIPRALARDYLASVVHYHELGHFVDIKYAITDSTARQLFQQWQQDASPIASALLTYFPFLSDSGYTDADKLYLLTNHLGEYFCDLFASQYVGTALNEYLIYLTEKQDTFSVSHPASTTRSQVVIEFVSGQSNPVIDALNNAMSQILGKQLSIRHEKLPVDDFYNFLPPVIQNDRQLHGLLPTAWDVWQGDWTPFQQNLQMDTAPSAGRIYTVLNNLVEKAIGNYIVTNKWTN